MSLHSLYPQMWSFSIVFISFRSLSVMTGFVSCLTSLKQEVDFNHSSSSGETNCHCICWHHLLVKPCWSTISDMQWTNQKEVVITQMETYYLCSWQYYNKLILFFFLRQRQLYRDTHLLWAIRTGYRAKFLMTVYYEREWETPVWELRSRLNIETPPLTPPLKRKKSTEWKDIQWSHC